MAEKIVLFEANVNMDQALKDTEELRKKTADLKKEADSYRGTEKENTAEHIKAQAAYRASAAELRTMENITTKLVTANNANSGSIKQLRAELAVVTEKWASLSKQERENSEEGKKITAEKLRLTEALKAEEKATGDSRRSVGEYENATKSLKLELRENIVALAQMKAAGEDQTEAYKKLLKATGELQDTIADTREEVKRYASDTQGLDQAIGIFKGIGSAAQVAESAQALLGTENEDLTKSIQKMVAIQSLLNGVQEIGNALQKESAFMIGVNTIQTKVATAAQGIYAVAVGASTGAMKAFRIALLATGIGAIIAAMIALIVNWDKLTGAVNGSAKAQEDYNNKIARMNEINEENRKFDEFKIKLLKERGAKDTEITNAEIINNLKRQSELEKEISLTEKKKDLSKEELEAQKKRYSELTTLQDDYILLGIRLEKQKTDELKKQQEERDKILKKNEEERKKKDEEERKEKEENDKKILEEHQKYLDAEAETERVIAEVKEAQRREAVKKKREEKKKEHDRKIEEDAINADNEYQLAQLRGQMLFDLDRENLALKQEQEIAAAEKVGADVNLINEKYALLNKKITQEEIKFKLGLASQFAGNLATIFGKNTKVGKLAASAQTAIDTYAGAISAYKSLAGIPYVGPVLGATAAAAVGVAGAKAIKDIWAVKSGLPGDSGGSSSTPTTGGASVNPSIGNGIVSRSVEQTGNQVNITTQPTLVVDDVTEAQQRKDRINKTQAI